MWWYIPLKEKKSNLKVGHLRKKYSQGVRHEFFFVLESKKIIQIWIRHLNVYDKCSGQTLTHMITINHFYFLKLLSMLIF